MCKFCSDYCPKANTNGAIGTCSRNGKTVLGNANCGRCTNSDEYLTRYKVVDGAMKYNGR